jgi:hypothetical protein
MSKEDLSRVIGRALVDHNFMGDLNKNPEAAAKSMGANLTADESKSLQSISLGHMYSISAALRHSLSPAMIYDGQNQQQQAQMD